MSDATHETAGKEAEDAVSKIGALIIIGILILLAIVPIYLLISYLVSAYKNEEIIKTLKGNLSDFWLNDDEKREFLFQSVQYSNALYAINFVKQNAHTYIRNQKTDSKDGQNIRLGLEIKNFIDQTEALKEESELAFKTISVKPHERWEEFSDKIMYQKAQGYSFLFWVAFYFVGIGISSYLRSTGYMPFDSINPLVLAIFISSLATIICFIVCMGVFIKAGGKYSPEPPCVDSSNIHNY